jgi:hypothetical protein
MGLLDKVETERGLLPSCMPKKRLTEAQRLQLEDTKQRLSQQEARTRARLEELEIEACEKIGRQLRLEHLELSGELECPETNTVRQYTLVTSDNEEDLTDEKTSSSVKQSELETPDFPTVERWNTSSLPLLPCPKVLEEVRISSSMSFLFLKLVRDACSTGSSLLASANVLSPCTLSEVRARLGTFLSWPGAGWSHLFDLFLDFLGGGREEGEREDSIGVKYAFPPG